MRQRMLDIQKPAQRLAYFSSVSHTEQSRTFRNIPYCSMCGVGDICIGPHRSELRLLLSVPSPHCQALWDLHRLLLRAHQQECSALTVSSFDTCALGLSEDLSVFVCLECGLEVLTGIILRKKFLKRTSSVSWILCAE